MDLPGPVKNTRTGTGITDKIRIVKDRTDKYGSPIGSVRSVRKYYCDLGIKSSANINEKGDGPYRCFAYLSHFSDSIDLAT